MTRIGVADTAFLHRAIGYNMFLLGRVTTQRIFSMDELPFDGARCPIAASAFQFIVLLAISMVVVARMVSNLRMGCDLSTSRDAECGPSSVPRGRCGAGQDAACCSARNDRR